LYFDYHPKTDKKDFYDRTHELDQFLSALSSAPLTVVTGLRRSGKTSFVNVGLKDSDFPYAFLDLRELPFNPSQPDIVRRLEAAFRRIDRKWFSDLKAVLRHLRGVSVLGNELSFQWGKEGIDLGELFSEIDKWASAKQLKFVIAFDEIQVIRGNKWMLGFLAHVADTYRNVPIVVTGSEIGLLFDFLGFDNPDSPLFGRHFVQVQMNDFSANEAEAFLVEGFSQIKMKPSSDVLTYAIEKLDGIPGWLTLFGVRCAERKECTKETVDEIASEAEQLVRAEVLKITTLSKRYAIVLNFLAKTGEASWSQVKSVMEVKEKKSVTNHVVSTVLKTLKKIGFVSVEEGKYFITDSLLSESLKRETLPEV
jgi:AAA+ ATPase superfamily predicted ATPase